MDLRSLKTGEQLDRYVILREAGRGGMGTIYQARDTVLGREVALKVLAREYESHREHRERFVREAQAAAKIRHRNVVAVHDVSVRGALYIVMEYLRGETFEAFVRREAPVSFERALESLMPVMAAVSAAHDSSVIHRDLKPANIMLAHEGDGSVTPKVLDFGISKVSREAGARGVARSDDPDLTSDDQQLGTPSYMAPEQDGHHRAVGPWSDAYAIALMLYLAVTGKRAFTGRSVVEVMVAKRIGRFDAPSSYPFNLPPALDAWMLRALSPDVRDRYASVREMATDLLAFAPREARAQWESVFALERPASLDPLDLSTRYGASTSAPPAADVSARDAVLDVSLPPDTVERSSVEVPAPPPPRAAASRRERSLVAALALMGVALGVTLVRDRRADTGRAQAVGTVMQHAAPLPPAAPSSPAAGPPPSPAPVVVAARVTPRPIGLPRRAAASRTTRCGPDAMFHRGQCIPVPRLVLPAQPVGGGTAP